MTQKDNAASYKTTSTPYWNYLFLFEGSATFYHLEYVRRIILGLQAEKLILQKKIVLSQRYFMKGLIKFFVFSG